MWELLQLAAGLCLTLRQFWVKGVLKPFRNSRSEIAWGPKPLGFNPDFSGFETSGAIAE